MGQAKRDELRRERLREYDAAVQGARSPVAVVVMFAKGREARAAGEALEEAFATTPVEGVDDANRLPAAVWVALRQGDIDATIDALVRMSRNDFVVSAHEQLDAVYKLTTVEERRGLPDVELLEMQAAAFLQLPVDVLAMIAGWGPEDPRTRDEIETLLERRFGSPALPDGSTSPAASTSRARAGLKMSSAEFTGLLNLAPEQCAVLHTLVRQSDVTIVTGE